MELTLNVSLFGMYQKALYLEQPLFVPYNVVLEYIRVVELLFLEETILLPLCVF